MKIISELAKRILDKSGDVDLARAECLMLATGDLGLQHELWTWAVNRLVDEQWRAQRAPRVSEAQWSSAQNDEPEVRFGDGPSSPIASALPAPVAVQRAEGLHRAMAHAHKRLMDFEMMERGARLKDACRPDIIKYVKALRDQARGSTQRAAFLESVAAMLPNNTTPVRAVLREADLARLLRRQVAA